MSGTDVEPSLEQLLPHRAPMILLERVLCSEPGFLDTQVTIRAESLFLKSGVVPAWVGVEYMAQTCACFAGMQAHARGEAARVGFLLGTRDYRSLVSGFELGATLRVRACPVHREEGGLSVMECQIYPSGQVLPIVEATLTLYELADLEAYLEQHVGVR
jgi:predicted hotdog family 3-hydroxylacyl-ACP dehydratase